MKKVGIFADQNYKALNNGEKDERCEDTGNFRMYRAQRERDAGYF